MLERALAGELTHQLGYEKHAKQKTGNTRNGSSTKTLKTKQEELEITIPRDRQASLELQLIAKQQTRWEGFDDLILSLYSRGLTTREIQSHLEEIYGVEVAPDFISTVTDSVLEGVKAWRNRPLEAVYPVVWFDALMVKIRHQNQVTNLQARGVKDILIACVDGRTGLPEALTSVFPQTQVQRAWCI